MRHKKNLAILAALMLAAACQTTAPPQARNFNAGPIWNQDDANAKCPIVAIAVAGHWNGQWVTTVPNEMSVCGIEGAAAVSTPPAGEGRAFFAGPIWDNDDAQAKCAVVAAAVGGAWRGHWWTTKLGEMSACMIEGARERAPYTVGPMVTG